MKCPVCQSDLQMSERSGVEIDYCPKCRGVWLDRGELDKIIERAGEALPEVPRAMTARHPYDDDEPEPRGGDPRAGRRRRGFLSEIFDFD